MKTVYVELTNNYSRTVWDSTGATTYNVDDRVEYNDGSRNRIFVCINSNNSTTEPQNNPTDWAPAGSEEYPFLLIDSTNNLRVITNSEWTLHGVSSSTVNFLAEELGTWTPDNPVGGNGTYQADGAGGTIILGDGRYTWDYATYAMWWPNNCTIQAKNHQKAYIIVSGEYWGGNNVTWKGVVFYSSQITNVVPGSYHTGYKHNLDGCLSTQETPWGRLASVKQEPSSSLWTRTLAGSWNGGYIRGCTFDYQYKGPSYLFSFAGGTGTGAVFENNTFYIRVKHSQYNLLFNTGNVILKNNIFYIKYLQDGHPTQSLSRLGAITEGDNVFYLENDSDTGGTISNNLSGGTTINPQFINAEKSIFGLRPPSPLIGGVKTGNSLEVEYPEGLWVDSNHTPVQASYSYTIEGGDSANYTFSGDVTGSDPEITSNTGDTLTFTNVTGGHPLAIYNSEGVEVASESSGTTTFTPKYPDTYYYQCTLHPNMRGNIIVTNGTLGSYENPFKDYYDAIDSGYYLDTLSILFKKGDHPLTLINPANYGSANPSISTSFPGGLYFIGEDKELTRLTTEDNVNGFCAFYFNGFTADSTQGKTPFFIKNLSIHVNTAGNVGRGIISGTHWKSFVGESLKITSELNSRTDAQPFDYFNAHIPTGYSFKLQGCEFNLPVSNNNSNTSSFLSGSSRINYDVRSCTFAKLSGYSYSSFYGNTSRMFYLVPNNQSIFKNCIFYTNNDGNFANYNMSSSHFDQCIFYSATGSFTNLPDLSNNSTDDPLFINVSAGSEDLRLRANSPGIGGVQTYRESASEWYVDLVNGDDANDGKTPATAMLTVAAAHTASINRDTIYIVNKELSLSSNLTLLGGRDYKPFSYCNVDGQNAFQILLSETGALETGLKGFNFRNLRGAYSFLAIGASTSLSVFKIEGCNFQGTLTSSKSAPIGGSSSAGCRSAADGSYLKNCTIDCTWGAASMAGSNSSSFVAVDRMNLIGCTFHVGKNSPISNTLFLVGTGGVGAWSHGPPYGPVLVKNCIIYGNEKMSYSYGEGGSLGFTSNTRVITSNANYLIHNTCIYGVRGTFGINETNRPYRGSLITEYLNSSEDIVIYYFDPKFIAPDNGGFNLRPDSPLIAKG